MEIVKDIKEIIEIRTFALGNGHECRAMEVDGKKFIEGYAAVFNQKSKLLSDWCNLFFEIIRPTAFDEVLKDSMIDVIMTFNHDYDEVFARTTSQTLKLSVDATGLKYIAELPATSFANDLYESVKRGDIFESSFTFSVDDSGQTWGTDEQGIDVRYISSIKSLRDVGPVTWGAYANTAVQARGLKEIAEAKKETNVDLFEKQLTLLKMKK